MNKKYLKYWPIVLSLLLHGVTYLVVGFLNIQPLSPKKDDLKVEWVEIIDDSKNSKDKLKQRQIVEQDDNILNNEKPTEDYKLSKHNQRVLKETKASHHGKIQTGMAMQRGRNNQAKAAQPQPKKTLKLSDLKPSMFGMAPVKPRLVAAAPMENGGGKVSQTDDYLKDIEKGSQTLLNTREFVYYSYYNRIKAKLRAQWEPRIKKKIVKILKKGRRVAATADKITKLVITLDKNGTLVRVRVKDRSGYMELDDAAVEAFRAAAPFPNPPKGMVDENGEIHINWDFVLES